MTRAQRERIIEKRKALGTQAEVAEMLDVVRNTVSNYERGEMPLWYPLAIDELYRRKQQGRKLSRV